jgi:HAD superfamily hydrolase (TIGR01509 family)
MDGVLIEAKDWHYEALNKALNFFGTEISRYDHLVTFDGLPTRKKLAMLSKVQNLPVGLHQLINDLKQRFTTEIVYSRCKPVFYHQYALSRLKSDGYRLAVCSNSIRRSIEIMMERADLDKYLDFFLSNQDVIKGKPDPEMYNKAIEKLKLTPQECLILEDNENGIKAALASGAHLLKINTVEDVIYYNILNKINEINNSL